MKINKKLLPIKTHYFFFMAAMGPILPQLSVYGKEMGISTVVMGMVTGILPFAFLVAKPLFGLLVDIYRDFRKAIFMMLIFTMTLSFALIALVPMSKDTNRLVVQGPVQDYFLDTCKSIDFNVTKCKNSARSVICTSECFHHPDDFLITVCDVDGLLNTTDDSILKLCSPDDETYPFLVGNRSCPVKCMENLDADSALYHSIAFWSFLILMSVGTIAFNVANSISDAICFDVIGEEYDYGKQRVWGTIGFGVTALISGYIVDIFSDQSISYVPAIAVMVVFSVIDLLCCFKLKLPIIEAPKNLFKDIGRLLNNRHVITFIGYAVLVGVLDGFIIYFLFWYVEDLALSTDVKNIKLIEGLIVAAETLGGEVIFFSISGKILQRFGHVHCFSICFINYGLRLGLISLAPSPWWILPIEFVFQGPTYALTYTTVVAYANELAPPGATATMQGIAAGMDDGVGYAFGSILGGILYKYIGGKYAFQAFSCLAILCSVTHLILHKTCLKRYEAPVSLDWKDEVEYKSPKEAVETTER
ncbi:major facilitator superfamily domain-containing protein 6 [Anthonomus grandis grandis]|uniref:major facilitator superfamily domain-containing protein 6 n=1 Tax=Anthonomus grandis grandis TaxID=2921223 RepID=UPI0021669F1B|nr:major facilitator superfamily domain-containing protein 6 [Anthonomus grandis grandis]